MVDATSVAETAKDLNMLLLLGEKGGEESHKTSRGGVWGVDKLELV